MLNERALPHFARPVSEWSNNHFPNRWVGRNGLVACRPRSPDLYPCDFCLWGWMKQSVYGNQQCPETIEELQQRVEVAVATLRGTAGIFFTYPCKNVATC